MKYFKVKNESDQVRVNKYKSDFLIKHELKTESECKKLFITPDFLKIHFDEINVNKNYTFFCFGARFLKTQTNLHHVTQQLHKIV